MASRYVMLIEGNVLRRLIQLRKGTKPLRSGPLAVRLEQLLQLLRPAAWRPFSSSQSEFCQPSHAHTNKIRRPSGNRDRWEIQASVCPCRRRHHALRGRKGEGNGQRPFEGHVPNALDPWHFPRLQGIRQDPFRPSNNLRLRNPGHDRRGRYRRIRGCSGWSTRTCYWPQLLPEAAFPPPPC